MQLTSNKDNLEILKENIEVAQKEILICSAWIRSKQLREILQPVDTKIREGKIKLKLLIRIGDPIDAKITDRDFFQYVEELIHESEGKVELKFHPKLHAKFYVVDGSFAMIGSFNLTGGGFGTEVRPGNNPELGLFVHNSGQVQHIREHFEELWNRADFETLENQDLLGIILNNSTHNFLDIVCLREPEVYEYVEIEYNCGTELEPSNRYMIGQIVSVEKMAQNFFTHPEKFDDWKVTNEFFEAYGGKGSLYAYARGIAGERDIYNEVWLAKVELSYNINPEGKNKVYNKIAPPVGAYIRKAQQTRLEEIYRPEGSLDIANMISNENVRVGFKPSEILRTHFAVYGATGSGKSFFTKLFLKDKLIEHIISKKGRVVVLDPHGEYSAAFQGELEGGRFKIQEKELVVFNEKKLSKSFFISDLEDLENALDRKVAIKHKSYIRNVLVELSRLASDNAVKAELTGKITNLRSKRKNLSSNDVMRLERLIRINPSGFIKPLYDIRQKLEKDDKPSVEDFFENSTPDTKDFLLNEAKSKFIDESFTKWTGVDDDTERIELLKFIYENIDDGKITFHQQDIQEMLDESKVYCFNFSKLTEIQEVHLAAQAVLTALFNQHKTKGLVNQKPTLVVVEEAHNFAPQGAGSGNPAAKIMAKIASEGRKFHLGMMVITQRPAYVNKNVLAQCSTQAIFRLINSMDIDAIKELVEGMSRENLYQLPKFQTGQAIFTGVGIPEPVVVKID